MKIGFVSTRLSGTDGVSLEVEKCARVLEDQGNDLYYCAGEISSYTKEGTSIPLKHFKRPTMVNQHSVYMADIKPLGFEFVELNGVVSKSKVEEARSLLVNRIKVKEITEHNFEIGRQYFSYRTLSEKLNKVISTFS